MRSDITYFQMRKWEYTETEFLKRLGRSNQARCVRIANE